MVPGDKPGSASHDTWPFHPEVFLEPRVDTFHYVLHKSTGLAGSSAIEGPFPGSHIILKILQDGAQVCPSGLALDANIRGAGFLLSRGKWKLSPTMPRSAIWHLQFCGDFRKCVSHKFIIFLGPIHNSYDLAGQIGFLAFRFKELECSDLLWVPANLLLERELSFTDTFHLMITDPVFPGFTPLLGLHFLPSWEARLLWRWVLQGIFLPGILGPGCRAHGHLL